MTWEVRRETTAGWISLYEYSGKDCYLKALKTMLMWQKMYPEYEWEIMG